MNNRYGATTTVSNQNQRRPLIHVLPDEVALRVVCHASVIGGIIGSNGYVVSKLRRETGTKIHCESPAANGSEHWVVFIVGSTAVNKSVLLTDRVGDFSGGEHEGWVTCQVSAAQTALIRVLERSWAVLAAKDSGGVVAEGDDNEAYCGILADRSQVGAVLGLGGKNVEWVRRSSGAMVRVLPPPSCGTNSDELIQITGDVLAVKKALVMVSTFLQNNPPLNGYPPPLCSKAYDSSTNDPHSENFPNLRSSSLPNASETAASNTHTPSRNRFQDSKDTERKVVFKLICTSVAAGGIIGRQGTIIRAMQNEAGASISIGAPLKVSGERVVTITARESLESRYSHAQKALSLVFARSVEIDVGKSLFPGALVKAKLLVPSQFANDFVGNRETGIVTGVDIHIPVGGQILDSLSENELVIEIMGEYKNVQEALCQVSSKLRENLSPKKVVEEVRARVSNPYNLQPSQQSTGRDDSLSVSDGEQDLNMLRISTEIMRSIDCMHTETNEVNGLTQGMKQLQLSSDGYLSSLPPRRSKGVSLRNVTLELAVEKDALAALYGRDGAGLNNLQQISGARVDVKDTTGVESMVLLSGNPEQTRTAMSLLISNLADQ
ncbi:unnamed protein product [Eruca vesicaria subsp. sativa]|uniref:K Homology domain-containing protein n=1 Tax=Eruca vesicaria subsp. sativa TaxID=29727 RepID=A0ABC8JQK0_ERUVS|nr:unnamed protein product [Eruca vesicaria subsp. sativa]